MRTGAAVKFYRSVLKVPAANWNRHILRDLKLAEKCKVKELSFGKRAMLMFELILEQKPGIFLIDDVLNVIDPLARHHICRKLIKAVASTKATVILVNAMGIHKIPRRLLFIENGEIIVHEETDQLQETLKKVILK
ncbi:MAG: hypothetical protein GY757_30710, partial [bacterium]|nr:hypothetical protein [bacterium]